MSHAFTDKEALIYRLKQEADSKSYSQVSAVEALEFRRDQYGLNASEFASILNMRPSHYSEFLSGKRGLPNLAMLRAIAIGVPYTSLLSG